jgi:hypothetical protein
MSLSNGIVGLPRFTDFVESGADIDLRGFRFSSKSDVSHSTMMDEVALSLAKTYCRNLLRKLEEQ